MTIAIALLQIPMDADDAVALTIQKVSQIIRDTIGLDEDQRERISS
jgi:hypothetical protein